MYDFTQLEKEFGKPNIRRCKVNGVIDDSVKMRLVDGITIPPHTSHFVDVVKDTSVYGKTDDAIGVIVSRFGDSLDLMGGGRYVCNLIDERTTVPLMNNSERTIYFPPNLHVADLEIEDEGISMDDEPVINTTDPTVENLSTNLLELGKRCKPTVADIISTIKQYRPELTDVIKDKSERKTVFRLCNCIAMESIVIGKNSNDIGSTVQRVIADEGISDTESDVEQLSVNLLKLGERCVPTTEDIERTIKEFRPELADALNEKGKERLIKFLREHIAAVQTSDLDQGLCKNQEFKIETIPNAKPIKVVPARVPLAYQQEVKDIINTWLEAGKIKPSKSDWASRIVVVTKKDGKKRVCVDYRALNALTIPDNFPLPDTQTLRESLAGSKYFATFDLSGGFNQMKLDPTTAHKTSFITEDGQYEFLVLPFGPMNGPSMFQRAITETLGDSVGSICLVYIDDIIVFAKTEDELFDRMGVLFDKLANAGLKLRADKCEIFRKKVNYLGHEITRQGMLPKSSRLKQIRDWPRPTIWGEVRSFLGLASYMRAYIKDFGEMSEPLYAMEKGKNKKLATFEWTEACQESFDKIKKALISPAVLRFPTRNDFFVLDTDASDTAFGACLQQIQYDEESAEWRLYPIAFGSKTCSAKTAARRWTATEKEMYAIVYFTRKWRHFLVGRRFILRTDHSALRWLFNWSDPAGKVGRWLSKLGEYNMYVMYRPGKENTVADALSRVIHCSDNIDREKELQLCSDAEVTDLQMRERPVDSIGRTLTVADTVVATQQQPLSKRQEAQLRRRIVARPITAADTCYPSVLATFIRDDADYDSGYDSDGDDMVNGIHVVEGDDQHLSEIEWPTRAEYDWFAQQRSDLSIGKVIDYYESMDFTKSLDPTSVDDEDYRVYCKDERGFSLGHDGLLFKEFTKGKLMLVVPRKLRTLLLSDIHNYNGHRSANDLVKTTLQKYWWPTVRKDAQDFVASCDSCLRTKVPTGINKVPMQLFEHSKPFEYVAMDIIGPMPSTSDGYEYILTIIDLNTRWVEAVPLRNQLAKTVADAFFVEWCARYGPPKKLLTDKGTNFQSELFTEFCKLLNIQKTRTTGYHPQGNGRCEKANGLLKQYITAIGAKYRREWHKVLPYALYAIRSAINSTTGFSPFELTFGEARPTSLVANDPKVTFSDNSNKSMSDGNLNINNDDVDNVDNGPPESAEMKKMQLGARKWFDDLVKRLTHFRNLAENKEDQHAQVYKRAYDKHTRNRSYKHGDKVLLLTAPHHFVHDKFLPRYEGPFQVLQSLEKKATNYKVQNCSDINDIRIVNVNKMKLYVDRLPDELGNLNDGKEIPAELAGTTQQKRQLRSDTAKWKAAEATKPKVDPICNVDLTVNWPSLGLDFIFTL